MTGNLNRKEKRAPRGNGPDYNNLSSAGVRSKHLRESPDCPLIGTDPMQIAIAIVLEGALPSKKNQLRPRDRSKGGRGHMYDHETKNQIFSLTTQARIQWGSRPPVEHPEIAMTAFVSNARKDRDGILTTVLDCLVKAGVLVDDSVKHCNGPIHIQAAEVIGGDERVQISVCVSAAQLRRPRK